MPVQIKGYILFEVDVIAVVCYCNRSGQTDFAASLNLLDENIGGFICRTRVILARFFFRILDVWFCLLFREFKSIIARRTVERDHITRFQNLCTDYINSLTVKVEVSHARQLILFGLKRQILIIRAQKVTVFCIRITADVNRQPSGAQAFRTCYLDWRQRAGHIQNLIAVCENIFLIVCRSAGKAAVPSRLSRPSVRF